MTNVLYLNDATPSLSEALSPGSLQVGYLRAASYLTLFVSVGF